MVAIQDEWSFPYSNAIPTVSEDHHHVCLFFTAPLEAKPLTLGLTPRTAQQIKFGEPVITGFTRSFAQRIPNGDILNGDLPNGERREYLKRMLFSGGVGQLDDRHLHKGQPEKDMLVVKVGGPAYRIAIPHRSTTSVYRIALPHRSG